MQEIDRVAVIIRPCEPMLAWINHLPDPEFKDLILEDIYQDCTVLLLPLCEDEDELRHLLEKNYMNLFTNELAAWCEDESLWPSHLNFNLFKQWFDVEPHSLVIDLGEEEKAPLYN